MRFAAIALAVALSLAGCGAAQPSGAGSPDRATTAPTDHTLDEGGVVHAPGPSKPTAGCVACHGADLRGATGPSCFARHGQKW